LIDEKGATTVDASHPKNCNLVITTSSMVWFGNPIRITDSCTRESKAEKRAFLRFVRLENQVGIASVV